MKNYKQDFPIFNNNPDMIFLDSSASAMKPFSVIDVLKNYYENNYANIHRGVYKQSIISTQMIDASRKSVADFINARSVREIIWTKGCTDSINKIANLLLHNNMINVGDNIYTTNFEHHSNMLPWRFVAKKANANLCYIPLKNNSEIDAEKLEKMFESNTPKILAFSNLSNVSGMLQDAKKITEIAHKYGAVVVLDCAQSIVHHHQDMQDIGCDFMAFSMHKLYGPSGVGILYGREEFLEKMQPIEWGGDMVKTVSLDDYEISDLPEKFEAGTLNIADIIAVKSAMDYVLSVGYDIIQKHDEELIQYALTELKKAEKDIGKITLIGSGFDAPEKRCGLIAFTIEAVSSFDIGTLLGEKNVCVRTGFHCAEPLHQSCTIGMQSVRISFGIYNDKSDVDAFIIALKNAVKKLS
ncbi:MAG: cysteine desulfurase [Rickettsiales bacterium]|jgi:cysteine desulfurase/selenocysteine lyase|nr:cysteine desulfurase [Rickettsiales bacterium]